MAAVPPGGRRALVLGGTGLVGTEVVRALRLAGVPTTFTWFRNEAAASEDSAACRVDLRDAAALRALITDVQPTVLVHAAAVSSSASLAELDDAAWDEAHAVNVRSAFVAVQASASAMAKAGGGDIVLVGALERAQSLPCPFTSPPPRGRSRR